MHEGSVEANFVRNARLAQKLARNLRHVQNSRRAFEISQQLAKVSKDLEAASRARGELDKHDDVMKKAVG